MCQKSRVGKQHNWPDNLIVTRGCGRRRNKKNAVTLLIFISLKNCDGIVIGGRLALDCVTCAGNEP